jgi:hypothetical protein
MNSIDPRLKEFVRLFNEEKFFDAHEVLEDLWLETEGELKDFYKGLIQCAVAFVHLQRGNLRGAIKLYTTASGYLRRYLPECEQINTEKLMNEFVAFFSRETLDRSIDPPRIEWLILPHAKGGDRRWSTPS